MRREASGQPVAIIEINTDITQRKAAENLLRQSEERFRTLTEVASQVVWLSSPRGEPAADSPSWREFTSRRPEQWLGWSWLEAIHPDDRARVAATWRNALESFQPYRDEYRLLHVSGTYRYVQARAVPVRTADGKVREWVGTLTDVTSAKRAEAARNTMAAIIADSDDAVIAKSLDGLITSWNRGAERLFGYSANEVLGKNIRLLIPPERQEEETRILADIRRGEKMEHYESQRLTRDGRLIDVSITTSPIHDSMGQIVGVSKIARDITERKRAEEIIRRRSLISEAINRLFREALACQTEKQLGGVCLTIAEGLTRSQSGFIGEINAEGQLDDIAISDPGSPTCKGMIKEGHTGYRILPRGFEIHGIYGQVLLDGKGFFTNDPSSHPDRVGLPEGHATLTAFLGVPLIQGDKKIGMIALANRPGGYSQEQLDALEELSVAIVQVLMRFKAEQALRQAQAQLRMVTDNMAAGVTRCSRDQRYLWVSPAYARWLGRESEEIVGRPIPEIIGAAGYEMIQPHIEQVLMGQRIEYETQVEFLGVGVAWISAVYTPTYDVVGEVDGWIAVVTDMSERKRTETALLEAKQQLTHANERLEQVVEERTAKLRETIADLEHFSYSITHDMRAPLRAMQSFASLLEEECGSCVREQARDYFRRIETAASRMDKLIQDSLDYAKVLRDELPLSSVDAAQLLREMIESYPDFQPWTGQIKIELDELPVLANMAALTQCFSNLLGNAIKFVAPGAQPQVRIWAEERGQESVRIWFEDHGIGIPEDARDKIFNMFYRVHADREYSGTGIGLAIVCKAARRMGGEIGVESELGRGSRFWLEFKKPEQALETANFQFKYSKNSR